MSTNDRQKKRVSVDLDANSAETVERMAKRESCTTAALFRQAMAFYKLYLDAKDQGKVLIIADPKEANRERQLEVLSGRIGK